MKEGGAQRGEREREIERRGDGRSKKKKDREIENPEERKQEYFLFSPEELRITLGEGWQKGQRERRRFSSCER